MAFAAEGAQQAPAFDAVRLNVESAVRQSKLEEVQARLLERLRAHAKIELYL